MRLTKTQREEVKNKLGGRCAYCGVPLGDKWHADHLEPVIRESKYVRGEGFKLTGALEKPANDTLENLMPACAPCNLDKHSMKLEDWRVKLQNSCTVLRRDSSTYRHALRFGLVVESQAPRLEFYFEVRMICVH